ncbi:hypothetical protein [Actinomadura sp. CNU-125]|uniref:hypothetical protein n=1 Tax=Actinomadura sp. CNU-125 TaxID=1904961 RepID=UPI0021CCF4F3|nr:hypothetical protein [Actinomadura sp. CNU-125]
MSDDPAMGVGRLDRDLGDEQVTRDARIAASTREVRSDPHCTSWSTIALRRAVGETSDAALCIGEE